MNKLSILESLLFVCIKPISKKEISDLMEISQKEVEDLIDQLNTELETNETRGIKLKIKGDLYSLETKSENFAYVEKLLKPAKISLNNSNLECLAIIAYKQPLTKNEINQIRGVDSYQTLKKLLDLELIKIVGKKEVIGRPSLLGTSDKFLELLNMDSLDELPIIVDNNIDEILHEALEKLEDKDEKQYLLDKE